MLYSWTRPTSLKSGYYKLRENVSNSGILTKKSSALCWLSIMFIISFFYTYLNSIEWNSILLNWIESINGFSWVNIIKLSSFYFLRLWIHFLHSDSFFFCSGSLSWAMKLYANIFFVLCASSSSNSLSMSSKNLAIFSKHLTSMEICCTKGLLYCSIGSYPVWAWSFKCA